MNIQNYADLKYITKWMIKGTVPNETGQTDQLAQINTNCK